MTRVSLLSIAERVASTVKALDDSEVTIPFRGKAGRTTDLQRGADYSNRNLVEAVLVYFRLYSSDSSTSFPQLHPIKSAHLLTV